MPMQRERYPDQWTQIAEARKRAAGWCCERCGVRHGSWQIGGRGQPFRVVLNVAHLGIDSPDGTAGDPRDKLDVRPENLAVLCQPCHLRQDTREHVRTLRLNRRRELLAAGQLELFAMISQISQISQDNQNNEASPVVADSDAS